MSLSKKFNDLQKALQNVIANPDDDNARLSYADLLPASEKDRKKYIKDALAWEQMKPGNYKWSKDIIDISMRMRQLELKHNADWRPMWDSQVSGDIQDCKFNRGFVEHVTIDANVFAKKADLVLAAAPIRHLDLVSDDLFETFPRSLFSNPALKGIRSLTITGNLSPGDIKALATSPYLKELRWLNLSYTGITYAGVETLVKNRATNLPNLNCVGLGGNPCNTVDVEYYDQGVVVERDKILDTDRLEKAYGPQPWLMQGDYEGRYKTKGNGYKPCPSTPKAPKGPK